MGQLVFQAALGGAVNLIGPNISATTNFTLPSADGTNGQALTTNGSGVLGFSSIVSGAAGSNTQVQFNSGGNFGASASLTWDGTNLTSTGFSGPHNGTVGATTANTGAFTTLTTSSTVTLNGGTANGVTYLNGSKVLTSGSALTFDGSTAFNFGGANAGGYTEFNVNNTSATGYARILFNIGSSGANGIGSIKYAPGIFFAIGTDSDSSSTPMTFNLNGSEQMRLTSTGLGIGTSSPAFKLVAYNSNTNYGGFFTASTGTYGVGLGASGSVPLIQGIKYDATANYADIVLQPNGGNLGLGVTPSAWASFASIFQGTGYALAGFSSGSNVQSALFCNAFFNGSNYIYRTTAAASEYLQISGQHQWFNAPSGTAGTAISFTQSMTLDASGNLALGLTSAARRLDIQGAASGETYQMRLGASPTYSYDIGRSTVDGYCRFYGNQTGYTGYIFGGIDGELARIDSSGNLLVGNSALLSNASYFGYSPGNTWGVFAHASGVSSGTEYIKFYYNNGQIGSITQSGTTAVLYNVTSDQRLKENIQDAESASSIIDALQVRQYDWKADGNHQRYGFVAQELANVYPEAVHQPTDPDEMMAVDYSKLVPMLVKEIQSLRKRLADAGL